MSIGSNIKRLREQRNMSQVELASVVGVSDKAVSTWENGTRTPRMGVIQRLADYFGVQKSAIIEDAQTQDLFSAHASALSPMPTLRLWPVIGATACGDPVHREIFDETVLAPGDIKADAVFRCDGDSMVGARIMDGDLVFIQFDAAFFDGGIYLIRIDDAYTLKRVYREPDTLRLVSENPKEPTRFITGPDLEQTEIVGKAVYFLSKAI